MKERQTILERLTPEEASSFPWDWRGWWARPDQLAPTHKHWSIWLILAGRGYGKTRVISEWVREQVSAKRASRIALVAPTAADVRDVLVEGPSGILACCPDWERPVYESSKRRMTFPNGAVAITYSADEPDRLRGPQHDAAACDELAAWRYPDAWDMLMFGLRMGTDPRCVIATTPKPVKLLKTLLAREGADVVVTRGSTYENQANLAKTFFDNIITKYEGTRLGRQELLAELLTDVPNALWQRDNIERLRVRRDKVPELQRVVIAIDPAATSQEGSDETGLIAAGLGKDHHGYVLEDISGRYQPDAWAKRAVKAFHDLKADRIVAEVNNGGEMVEATIRTVNKNVSYKAVHATRGKVMRAEPIAALYEQGKIHHVGTFPQLEDQLCFPAGTLIETRRGDLSIESVTTADEVMTRRGWRPVEIACDSGCSSEFVVIETTDGGQLRCTPNHPIFDAQQERFVTARNAFPGMHLDVRPSPANTETRLRGAGAGITEWRAGISATPKGRSCIERYGRLIADRFRAEVTSIISIAILATIDLRTWSYSPLANIPPSTNQEDSSHSISLPAVSIRNWLTRNVRDSRSRAFSAAKSLHGYGSAPSSAQMPAGNDIGQNNAFSRNTAHVAANHSLHATHVGCIAVRRVMMLRTAPESVFNLRVSGQPEYYANGVLVHNCEFTLDFDRSAAGYSPDRLDALVWALTELMPEKRSFFG